LIDVAFALAIVERMGLRRMPFITFLTVKPLDFLLV
jgi:hypothetical protein